MLLKICCKIVVDISFLKQYLLRVCHMPQAIVAQCSISWSQKFLFGESSYSINIFIKITPVHTYIDTLFLLYTHIYIHTLFYLISYIYTHTQQKKKKKLSIFNQNYI